MVIDEVLRESVGIGDCLEQQGLLVRVPIGGIQVIGPRDPWRYVGTTTLCDCAGIGLVDRQKRVCGIAHIIFSGTEQTRYDARFCAYADALLAVAREKGGDQFIAYLVNVRTGMRRLEENILLGQFAQEWIQQRMDIEKDVVGCQWLNGQGFYIDKTTGLLLPY